MANYNLIIKQKEYQDVRSVIVASQSGNQSIFYAEGNGDRYYINQISATATPVLEAATFNSFLSFTMSGLGTFSMQMVPMATGESVFIDMQIYGQNSASTKGYAEKVMTAYRHSGSALSRIGAIQSNKISDFTSAVGVTFSTTATASVDLIVYGETGELIDFDIYIQYKKGYHAIQNINQPQTISPIYPSS
jgi:hypothetical protein